MFAVAMFMSLCVDVIVTLCVGDGTGQSKKLI